MNRAAFILLIGLCVAHDASAHEFWVQPDSFWLQQHAVLDVTLQVGDGALRQRSPIPLHRITRFDAVGPAGDSIDLRASLSATAKRDVTLDEPGTYVLALETDDHAYSRQSAVRFNDYLVMEGLTPVLDYRTRTHQMHVDGFERYSRAAKSIVLVGPPGAQPQRQVTTPLGLQLEVVPEVNPYAQPRPARLPVRVIYQGQPLAGALVKLMSLEHDLFPADARRTDASGATTFAMPQSGRWLVSVVWTRQLDGAADADYETIFASLTFGLTP